MNNLLSQVKREVDRALASYLKNKDSNLLVTEIKRTIFSGGKRIRPAFFYYAYRACGGKKANAAYGTGAAFELFHTFALIHDDIIDRSDTRRGVVTVRGAVGENTALLAGDLCFVFSHDLFYRTLPLFRLDHSHYIQAISLWQRLQEEMLFGEYLDTAMNIYNIVASEKKVHTADLVQTAYRIMDLKTARYTIERPLMLGAVVAQAPKNMTQMFSDYGRKLGVAFQIRDDILGMFGDEATLGKSVDSDLKEGKLTLLTAHLLERLSREQKGFKEKLHNAHWVREKIKTLGILEACEKKASSLAQEAMRVINTSSLPSSDKKIFLDLASHVVKRRY